MRVLLAGLLGSVVLAVPQAAMAQFYYTWIPAEGRTCSDACAEDVRYDATLKAIQSGIWSENGQPFYVCAANPENEGFRPGYNLPSDDWADRCVVGYGNDEVTEATYDCLCTIDNPGITEQALPETTR